MTSYRSIIHTILILHTILSLSSHTLAKSNAASQNVYKNLAQYLSKTITTDETYPIPKIQSTLSTLSKSQSTLKSIDGASHEFYQRSHSKTLKGSSGRVDRSAGRVGCCADSLFGCELLDWMDASYQGGDANNDALDVVTDNEDQSILDDGTLDLHDRQIILNSTIDDPLQMQIIVLYEEDYSGGAGMNHGGIDGLTLPPSSSQRKRGRYLILLKDAYGNDMEKTLECLDSNPEFFDLDIGLVSGEVASVNKILWNAAKKVLESCAGCWDIESCPSNSDDGDKVGDDEGREGNSENEGGDSIRSEGGTEGEIKTKKDVNPETLPALHFIGRSLAGGVASLAAGIVDGCFPMPQTNTRKRKSGSRNHRGRKSSKGSSQNRRHRMSHDDDIEEKESAESDILDVAKTLEGFGSGRSSALALGPPPSISANIKAAFITSVIVGDDIICRASKDSLDRLRDRATKRLEGGVITKQVGWMTDTLSLTLSSLQSHAHGSEGEEARLSIPGKVYLVRPRSIGGGVSSIHEIGRGRDALRATVLWQLNDILLSRSLWKHHYLESYILTLDKVQLRQISEEEDEEEGEFA